MQIKDINNPQKYNFSLFADYFQFYLQDENAEGELSESWSSQAVGEMLALAAGIIAVGTVRNSDVPVEVEILDQEPTNDNYAYWDHITECSMEVPSGKIIVAGCTDYLPEAARIIVKPDCYRARIFYGALNSLSSDGVDGEDHYKIILWPEQYKKSKVIKGEKREEILLKLGVKLEDAQKVFTEIVDHYSSEGRYYHTVEHVYHVMKNFRDSNVLTLAAWFHDVIYDTRAKDNEEKSAEYAEKVLSGVGVPGEVIARVKELVLATKSHQAPPDDLDCQIFLDCDLAILGAPQNIYDEYAKNIRLEYSWVAEEDYRRGRKQVLEKFLQRDRIFYVYNYEGQARRNLERELASLG